MTRHERCLAAIEGRQVDRPPRYIPAIACEVSSRILGRPVHTGTGSLHYAETLALARGGAAHADFVDALFHDLAELGRALDIDVYRMPWRQTVKPTRQLAEHSFLFGDPDGDHEIHAYMPETGDFGIARSIRANPLADPIETLRAKVEAGEARLADGELARVELNPDHRRICEAYGDEFFIPCNGGEISVGYDEDMLMAMITHPDLVRRYLMLQAERGLALGRALANSPYPKVLLGGGDMAGNDGPFFSPESFRQVHLPALKYMVDGLTDLGIHYVFRTDGNLWSVADMIFREAACPGYGEVDRDAGMTTIKVRQAYPDLVLWNNLSCPRIQLNSPEWVREESRRCIAESGGTRYFHGSSNALIMGTPVANVEALFSD
ncbi:MAG: uroporphyrinogen decarboxylase family protein [Opitutaceae bacterium]